jgi:pimeloyl-ACP methyl ester carboxylesterase
VLALVAASSLTAVEPSQAVGAGAASSRVVRDIAWGPCPIELPTRRHVDCGSLLVPEDRGDPGSPTIEMAFAIVRAPEGSRPAPIVFLMGGPGYPGIDAFSVDGYFGRAAYTRDRDLILVDYRGNRSSDPFLSCPEFDRLDERTWPEGPTDRQVLATHAACHDRLEDIAELRHYGSLDVAKDVRDLRVSLGLERWNVVAFSAGGEPAFQLLRIDADGVRAAILDAPVTNLWRPSASPWWPVEPLDRMFRLTFDGCRAQPACDRAFPDLERRFMRLVERLDRHPERVELPVEGGGTVPLRVTGDILLQDVGFALGDPTALRFNPALVDWVVRSDLQEFYGFPIGPPFPIADFIAEGFVNSYRCREFSAFQTPERVGAQARRFPTWSTFAEEQAAFERRVCDAWDVGRAPAWMGDPVRSAVPTLVFQGEWDIAVPNPPIEVAAGSLPEGTLVRIPGIGHGALVSSAGWQRCPRSIAERFLNRPALPIDLGCIDDMPRVRFATGFERAVAPDRGQTSFASSPRLPYPVRGWAHATRR